MPGTVIQGCFPHGVKVTVQPHAAVSPSWVQQRIAASGRATPAVTWADLNDAGYRLP